MKIKITDINIKLPKHVELPTDLTKAIEYVEDNMPDVSLATTNVQAMIIRSNIAILKGYDITYKAELLPDSHIILDKIEDLPVNMDYGLSCDNFAEDELESIPSDAFHLQYPTAVEIDTEQLSDYMSDTVHEYYDFGPSTPDETVEDHVAFEFIAHYLPVKIFMSMS